MWTPTDVGELAALAADALQERGTVYTEDPATGTMTKLDRTNLPCRLVAYRQISGERTGRNVAQMLRTYLLQWDAGYTMPEPAQVAVSGERWNVVEGQRYAVRAGETVLHWEAEVLSV